MRVVSHNPTVIIEPWFSIAVRAKRNVEHSILKQEGRAIEQLPVVDGDLTVHISYAIADSHWSRCGGASQLGLLFAGRQVESEQTVTVAAIAF